MSDPPPTKKQKMAGDHPAGPPSEAKAAHVDAPRVGHKRPEVNGKYWQYYNAQGVFHSEEDREALQSIWRQDLPMTFRVVKGTPFAVSIRAEIKRAQDDWRVAHPSVPCPLSKLEWLEPVCDAYQLAASRHDIRSNPILERMRKMIVAQNESGTLFRQEAVSMIPITALKILGHGENDGKWSIIDMCAAPGSKTSQIAELLNGNSRGNLIIANDVSSKRGHMLISRLKHCISPDMVVTCHEAQEFPNLYRDPRLLRLLSSEEKTTQFQRVQFDRVLCDVPCSGDGTIRKNPSVGKQWDCGGGNKLFRLQCDILKRGLDLLKTGGYLVYSTCSLNPIENEAVVHAVLKEAKGSIELIKVDPSELPYRIRPGLTSWKVPTGQGTFATSVEEVDAYIKEHKKTKFPVDRYMVPPGETDEMTRAMLRDSCQRLMPQDNNTGAFFVVTIKKIGPVPWKLGEDLIDEKTFLGDIPQEFNLDYSLTQDVLSIASLLARNPRNHCSADFPYSQIEETMKLWLAKEALPADHQKAIQTIWDQTLGRLDMDPSDIHNLAQLLFTMVLRSEGIRRDLRPPLPWELNGEDAGANLTEDDKQKMRLLKKGHIEDSSQDGKVLSWKKLFEVSDVVCTDIIHAMVHNGKAPNKEDGPSNSNTNAWRDLKHLRVVNAGLVAFSHRNSSDENARVTHRGCSWLVSFLRARGLDTIASELLVRARPSEILPLLRETSSEQGKSLCESGATKTYRHHYSAFDNDGIDTEVVERLEAGGKSGGRGSCVNVIVEVIREDGEVPLYIPIYLGKNTLEVMVDEKSRAALIHLFETQ